MMIPEPPQSSHGQSYGPGPELDGALDLLFDPIPARGAARTDIPPAFLSAVRKRHRTVVFTRVASAAAMLLIAIGGVYALINEAARRDPPGPSPLAAEYVDPLDHLVQGRRFMPGPGTVFLTGGGKRLRGSNISADVDELRQLRPGARVDSSELLDWIERT
jgi:hypothetical protein